VPEIEAELMLTSEELLREFCRNRSEAAFHELVRRHLDLVYATARRVTNGDAHLAEDISQKVFMDLAVKASRLPSSTIVAGWLYQHSWFTAANAIRTERRRIEREQQALEMNALETAEPTDLARLRSLLDSALNSLNAGDRDALVLRFFQERDLRRVGDVLGVSEDAAQKRVSRALEKLRGVLSARGFVLSCGALTTFLSGEVAAAPAGLAQRLGVAALSGVIATPWLANLVGSVAAKATIATALVLALGIPMVLQQRHIAEQADERNLLLGKLAALESENNRLQRNPRSEADLDHINAQLAELHKLRGEITLLRRRSNDVTRARVTESALDEPATKAEKLNVVIEARIAELDDDLLPRLEQLGFPARINPRDFTLMLPANEARTALKLLEATEGVDLLSAPRVTTVDGREAHISVTEDLVIDGQNIPLGVTVQVIPSILNDGTSVSANLKIVFNEFLGWQDEAQRVPRLRKREASHQSVFSAGQMLVMGRSHKPLDHAEPVPKLHLYCITVSVVDSFGTIVHAPSHEP
jgi:RNA polymerase sigma factor (sigma-70 family)